MASRNGIHIILTEFPFDRWEEMMEWIFFAMSLGLRVFAMLEILLRESLKKIKF